VHHDVAAEMEIPRGVGSYEALLEV